MGFGERGGGVEGSSWESAGEWGFGGAGVFSGGGRAGAFGKRVSGMGLLANGSRGWGFWQMGLGDGAFAKGASSEGRIGRERGLGCVSRGSDFQRSHFGGAGSSKCFLKEHVCREWGLGSGFWETSFGGGGFCSAGVQCRSLGL